MHEMPTRKERSLRVASHAESQVILKDPTFVSSLITVHFFLDVGSYDLCGLTRL
jgi:hypothetical protein